LQAVILAGGRGERLRPLTDNIPKPMVPIKGKSFLEHQILFLKKAGITDYVLLTGYLSNIIENYFQDGSKFNIHIQYSVEDHPLGTGGAIIKADKLIQDDFLLINGDTLTPLNFKDMIQQYQRRTHPILIAVYDNRKDIAPNNIRVASDGTITGYSKTSPTGMTHIDSGVLAIKKDRFFGLMPGMDQFSFELEVYPKLIKNRLMKAYITNRRFYDIGTPERLKTIEEIL
jgi:mannose-1-phosphate guanylyltransferase